MKLEAEVEGVSKEKLQCDDLVINLTAKCLDQQRELLRAFSLIAEAKGQNKFLTTQNKTLQAENQDLQPAVSILTSNAKIDSKNLKKTEEKLLPVEDQFEDKQQSVSQIMVPEFLQQTKSEFTQVSAKQEPPPLPPRKKTISNNQNCKL